jgi:hypothetical protein
MEKSEEIITKLRKIKKYVDKDEKKNKNSQIHLFVETGLLNQLKNEAKKQGVSVYSLCRQKLRNDYDLKTIKESLNELKSLIIKFPKT